jgi:hypothetical protein
MDGTIHIKSVEEIAVAVVNFTNAFGGFMASAFSHSGFLRLRDILSKRPP